MAAPSPTLDPIGNSNLWHKFQLKGVLSPGRFVGGLERHAHQRAADVSLARPADVRSRGGDALLPVRVARVTVEGGKPSDSPTKVR